MIEDGKMPKIRFKGFFGEWQKRTMLKCSSKIGDGLHGTPKYVDNTGIYFINGNNLASGSILITDETKQVSVVEKSKSDNSLDLNTLLLSINGTIGNLAWYQGQNVMLGKSVAFIKLENCANDYMYSYLQTERIKNHFLNSLTGSTIKNLGLKAIRDSTVLIPEEHEEQTQIGNFFQKLDNLINQHQQKHNKLSNIKKAMLEKMFPKQGETVPEIRFKGFGGEWGERSWCDTVDISTNMVDPRNSQYGELFHVGPGNIESFTGRFYDNVLKVKDSNLISGKFHFNQGDIIYGKINPQLAKYVIAPFEGLASADAYVLNTKNGVVQSYLFTILHSEDFYEYTVSVSSRTGMPKINRDELSVYRYMAPNEQEQTLIGNYFQKLDTLINQHQQQITKLNNIKQACLSKMFV